MVSKVITRHIAEVLYSLFEVTIEPKSTKGRETNKSPTQKGETMPTEAMKIGISIHQNDDDNDFVRAQAAIGHTEVLITDGSWAFMLFLKPECAEHLANSILQTCREIRGDDEPETFLCDGCRKDVPIDDDYHIINENVTTCSACNTLMEESDVDLAAIVKKHCNAG